MNCTYQQTETAIFYKIEICFVKNWRMREMLNHSRSRFKDCFLNPLTNHGIL